MSHYKPYSKYKDSGVEWLGRVPEHWSVKRLRYAADLNPSIKAKVLIDQNVEVSFLPMEAIGEDGSLNLEQTRSIVAMRNGYSYFENGDVAFAKVTPCFENGKGALLHSLVGGVGFGTTELTVLRPKDGIDARFLNYIVQSGRFRAFGAGSMTGAGGLKRVPDEFTRNFETAWPEIVEQQAIAAHLHRETTRIDALIAKKTRFIELLREKRQSLITHAVTKGLDPNVKMKDSGVEWIGEVPEHWVVSRLGHFASVENGTTPSKDNQAFWLNGTIPWLGSGEVNQQFVTGATESINELALRSCSLRLLPVDTVIIGMVGQGKTRGLAAILRIAATINQNLAAICTGPRLRPLFLLYVFRAAYEWIREAGRGSNQAAMNCEIIGEFRFGIPSTEEQDAIISRLSATNYRIDLLITKTQHSIDLLKERRAALITAAVTGQIDVRDAA